MITFPDTETHCLWTSTKAFSLMADASKMCRECVMGDRAVRGRVGSVPLPSGSGYGKGQLKNTNNMRSGQPNHRHFCSRCPVCFSIRRTNRCFQFTQFTLTGLPAMWLLLTVNW